MFQASKPLLYLYVKRDEKLFFEDSNEKQQLITLRSWPRFAGCYYIPIY